MIAKMLSAKQIKAFQKEILDWFEKNKRDLPWRHSREPYPILVSEVMLQQTQVPRVIPKFKEWMEKFPDLKSLSEASFRDVLSVWSGLGYNRRALYLQQLAKELVKNKKPSPQPSPKMAEGDYSDLFPRTEKELVKLPGIGKYTARAILCFAFNQQIAVVDTNVKKVILTQFSIFSSQFSKRNPTEKEIQEIADQLLPEGKAYEWNQALMDYASAMLKNEKIHIPKQSHFKTSNRFYRGQVVKLLLRQSETVDSLFEKIENNGITKEKFREILKQMEKDGLVLEQKGIIHVPTV